MRWHVIMLAFVHAHGFSPSKSSMLVQRPSGPAARSSAYAQERTAVVVGCGPAGLAAALVCARNHNFKVGPPAQHAHLSSLLLN